VSDPAELRARLRQPFAVSSGTAGTNLRKTARYAPENCDPLQRIIVMSAQSSETGKAEALSAGAYEYISKPFSIKELMSRIQPTT